MSYKNRCLIATAAVLLAGGIARAQISPTGVTLGPSQQQQFSVPGQGQAVWTVVPPIGTITPNGIYKAPAQYYSNFPQVYIYALTGSMYYTTVVHLSPTPVNLATTPAAPAPTVSISVSPSSIYLQAGQSRQFWATVQGSQNQQVSWSVQGPGSIYNGMYTAPGYVATDSLVTIFATSQADPSKTASATIELGPATPAPAPAPTPAPAPATVSVTLSATNVSLQPGQSHLFTANVSGTSNTAVSWVLSPNVGSINNGFYTAPATVSTAQTVTLTATSVQDSTKAATAWITLSPAPPPTSNTNVSPATVTLGPSGLAAFSVGQRPIGTAVNWSVNPPIGLMGYYGTYQAPSRITSPQTISVIAVAANTQAVVGTANITLMPATTTAPQSAPTAALSPAPNPSTPAPSASSSVLPTTTTIGPGGTAQFSVQNAPAGTSVTWSTTPATGTINSAGLYTAPSSVATQTGVNVWAYNSSGSLLGGGIVTITAGTAPAPTTTTGPISMSPTTANIGPGGTAQFTMLNLPAGTSVTWSTTQSVGTISSTGLYTAPASITAQTSVNVYAYNSKGSLMGGAIVTIRPGTSAPTPAPTTPAPTTPTPPPPSSSSSTSSSTGTITMPIEVIGPDGYTAGASFNVPSGTDLSGQLLLAMTIHGLRFDGQASVKVNSSAWLPISTGNVTLLGNAAAYGGIGGGFHTLQMTMNLPTGAVVTGNNTITFRFNGTEGRVSGFRVLAFNIQTSAGSSLLPSSDFVQDDPNTWQPPSTSASDISAGQSLWHTAALTIPNLSGGAPIAIKAHCSDCHAQDGRDLKYFNYSNNSIIVRSEFHGLSAAQGAQIASYIRNLNMPNPGRPWNPPYQPGPGLDSLPVSDWSAGAGLGAVQASDQDVLNEVFPGGVQPNAFSPTGVLDVRETAIQQQLPDWNSWLPMIAPVDAWPDFAASKFNTDYTQLRNALVPGSAAAYAAAANAEDFGVWIGDYEVFIQPKVSALPSTTWTPSYIQKVYSTPLWAMVKSWEINQEFGLEGMAKAVFTNPKAEPRAWLSQYAFLSSPNMLQIPKGVPGLDNGSIQTWMYLAYIWYHTQLILNNGEYQQDGASPIDWGYVYGFISELSVTDSQQQAGLLNLWNMKAIQISDNGQAPAAQGPGTGWNWLVPDISRQVTPTLRSVYSGTSASERTAISSAAVQGWLTEVQQFTPQQYRAQDNVNDPSGLPIANQPDSPYLEDRVWYMIPRFRYLGVSQTLVNQMATWAQGIWPSANWSSAASATCFPDPGDATIIDCNAY